MEVDYQTFYSSYLKEYHIVKAVYLKKLLDWEEDINKQLSTFEPGTTLTKNTRFIIQAELRQNYFHAVETFFELFFAMLPTGNSIPDDRKIIERLSKSNWRKNYAKIEAIAKGKMKLDFLDEKIEFMGHKVSVGHYLFYLGIFPKDELPKELFDSINSSVSALKDGIRIIAREFSDREEYNAYKHALRIFPSFKSIHIIDAEKMEEVMNFDLSDSVSYHVYDEANKKISVRTNMLDAERNYQMAFFCGNMIYDLVYFRNLVYGQRPENADTKLIPIRIFGADAIKKCSQHNVRLQDLTFSTKEILVDKNE